MAKNQILAHLSKAEYERIAPHLTEMTFDLGETLWNPAQAPQHIYFPLSGFTSMLILLGDGSAGEVALIGNEGIVGLTGLLPGRSPVAFQTATQAPSRMLQMSMKFAREEVGKCGELHHLVLHYSQSLLAQISTNRGLQSASRTGGTVCPLDIDVHGQAGRRLVSGLDDAGNDSHLAWRAP